MASLNIAPLNLGESSINDPKILKKLQSYLLNLTDQLRFTLSNLSLDDMGDLTGAISGSMLKSNSIGDDKLYARYLLADTAHITFATIEQLTADYINAQQIEAKYATIEKLTASTFDVTQFNADMGNIKSLLAGNVGAGSFQSLVINSVNARIANATITSAMIKSIDTSVVNVTSASGRLKIIDNTMQIKDASDVVRVQIGKDASDDYGMYVWDASGNLMFDSAGLKADGIKKKIIRDSMVADDAKIAGGKVYLYEEEDTLSVLFSSMGNKVGNLTTSLSTANGLLSSLISQTESAEMESGTTLYSKYSSLKQTVEGLHSTVSDQQTTFDGKIETMKSTVSDISQTSKDLTLNFTNLNNYINGDGTKEGLSAYFQFSSDGFLEIGKSNSTIKSRQTNDRYAFYDKGVETAYFGSSVLHVKNVEVVDELRMGHFIYEPRDNGNLSLKWRA